jgi:AbrB family looped-hinge helix DNA binding protein
MIKLDDGTCICGVVKVGERGQIVIPKEARDFFNIKAGDSLFVTGSEQNQTISIFKANNAEEMGQKMIQINTKE